MVRDESFLSDELTENPHPYLHQLRAEDPVHWSETHQAWVLTRHDDVGLAFRDPRLSSARIGSLLPSELSPEAREGFDPLFRFLANWMVFKDPPDHAHLRRLARAAFAVRSVETLRPMILRIVDERLDQLVAAGQADFVATFAYPVPAAVIAAVLGVPEDDFEKFRGWSEEIVPMIFGSAIPDRRERGLRGITQLEKYFRGLLARAKRENVDSLLGDLSRAEEKGEVLSDDEVIATCILLLFAGHETTASLLGSGLLALDRFPEEREKLRQRPDLAVSAVEELLRFDGPSKAQVRIATEPIEMRGRKITAGQRVILMQAAANRDPERFSDPDRIDVGREDNDHYAFGYGIHHCLGAPLARLEAQIALPRIFERLPGLRVTDPRPTWRRAILSRGLERLAVAAG